MTDLTITREDLESVRDALNTCIDMGYGDGKTFDEDAVKEALAKIDAILKGSE